MSYDYYNINTYDCRRFRFFKLYRYLLTDSSFDALSSEAKIAYSLFENRHQISIDNKTFHDDNGKVFIYFSRQEIIDSLNISPHKAAAIMKELLEIGLIERSKKLGGFDGSKGAQYRLYVNDYVDLIKDKARKTKIGLYDAMRSRDFIMIPFVLFDKDSPIFKLPVNVKITYAVLLNLCLLSMQSDSYHDDNGNIYVKLSVKELQSIFGAEKCSKSTAMRYFDRLVSDGIIERAFIKGENVIYVKNVISAGVKTDTTAGVKNDTTEGVKTDTTEGVKTDTTEGVKTHTTEGSKTDTTEGVKTDTTYNILIRKELIRRELIRQTELEELELESENSTSDVRFDEQGYAEYLSVISSSDPQEMIKRLDLYRKLVRLVKWVSGDKERIYTFDGRNVTAEQFTELLNKIDDFDLIDTVERLAASKQKMNLNYHLAALYTTAAEKGE